MLLILKTMVAFIATSILSFFYDTSYSYTFFFLILLCLELLSVGINYHGKSDMHYLLYTAVYTATGVLAYFQLPLVAIGLVIAISIKRNHYINKLENTIKKHKKRVFSKKLKTYLRNASIRNKRTANKIYNAHFKSFFDYEQNKRSMYVYKD